MSHPSDNMHSAQDCKTTETVPDLNDSPIPHHEHHHNLGLPHTHGDLKNLEHTHEDAEQPDDDDHDGHHHAHHHTHTHSHLSHAHEHLPPAHKAIAWTDDFQPEIFDYHIHPCPVCESRAVFHASITAMETAFNKTWQALIEAAVKQEITEERKELINKLQNLWELAHLAVSAHRTTDAVNRTIWSSVEEDHPELLNAIAAKAYFQYQAYEKDCFLEAHLAFHKLDDLLGNLKSESLKAAVNALGNTLNTTEEKAGKVWEALSPFLEVRNKLNQE